MDNTVLNICAPSSKSSCGAGRGVDVGDDGDDMTTVMMLFAWHVHVRD